MLPPADRLDWPAASRAASDRPCRARPPRPRWQAPAYRGEGRSTQGRPAGRRRAPPDRRSSVVLRAQAALALSETRPSGTPLRSSGARPSQGRWRARDFVARRRSSSLLHREALLSQGYPQALRRRVFFALAFARLVAGFAGRDAADFLTSSTTSCHQCSAGSLSKPSSRRRVSPNWGSWCQPSQSARLRHVPTITRRSGLSVGWRSCPPTQPGLFFAADRRARIAASHSPPASSFRWTCVTIVIIELVLLR
jgi:hypothetical protein